MDKRFINTLKTIKMIAKDKAAVINTIGSYNDDYFTRTAKDIRKMMSGIGTSGNLSQDDIDYTLQQAVNSLHDPKTKWFTMNGNGMPFPCKADAVKAVVAYVQNIDKSGLKDKINRSIEGDIGSNIQGYNEEDSKLIKNVFGGQYKDIENNDKNIIKFVGLIETPCHFPKPQGYGERMRYMNDYAERAKMLGMVDAIRIVADNKDAIRKITSCKAGDDIGTILQNSFSKVDTSTVQNIEDGGPGSGNWGHKGRQGKHGGSMKGGGKHNRSAKSEAFEAAQGSQSLEGVSASWTNKSGRKGWGQGYVTAKNDWVNRLTGEKNTKADKLIRKWAEKPPQDEAQRKAYDPILSAERNVFHNGTIQQRKQFLDLKKEARMFDQRQEKLYEQLSQGQKMLYDSLTGHADLIDQNTGQVIQQEGRRNFEDLSTFDKAILLDLQQKMLGGQPRSENQIKQYAESLMKKYGYDPKKHEKQNQDPKQQPKDETEQYPKQQSKEEPEQQTKHQEEEPEQQAKHQKEEKQEPDNNTQYPNESKSEEPNEDTSEQQQANTQGQKNDGTEENTQQKQQEEQPESQQYKGLSLTDKSQKMFESLKEAAQGGQKKTSEWLRNNLKDGDIITSGSSSFVKNSDGTYFALIPYDGIDEKILSQEYVADYLGKVIGNNYSLYIMQRKEAKQSDQFDFTNCSAEDAKSKIEEMTKRLSDLSFEFKLARNVFGKYGLVQRAAQEYKSDKLDPEQAQKLKKEVEDIKAKKPFKKNRTKIQKQKIKRLQKHNEQLERQKELQTSVGIIEKLGAKAVQNYVYLSATLDQAVRQVKSRPDYLDKIYESKARKALQSQKITRIPPKKSSTKRTTDQIVHDLAGGDLTGGSCASLSLAYAVCASGYDVLDFRGGNSRDFFSIADNFEDVISIQGLKPLKSKDGTTEVDNGLKVLHSIQADKEHIFAVGKHAAIVKRNKEGYYYYLQLQNPIKNGWTYLGNTDAQIASGLISRFHARSEWSWISAHDSFGAMAVSVQQFGNHPQSAKIVSYLNTNSEDQKKGKSGWQK